MSRIPLGPLAAPADRPSLGSLFPTPPVGVIPAPDALTLDAVLDFAVVGTLDEMEGESVLILEDILSVTQVGGTVVGLYVVPCTHLEYLILRYRATLRQSFAMPSLSDSDLDDVVLRVLRAADGHATREHPLFAALWAAFDALEDAYVRECGLRARAAQN